MKALITGGAGFIGSHLAEELLSRGHQVIAYDNLSTGRRDNIAHLQGSPGFSFHHGSILEESDLSDVMEQADCIYHLAAAVGVMHVLEHPVTALETNARGASNVLRLAQQQGKKKVVLASSSEVYGKASKLPFREDDDTVLGPTSVSRWGYACVKAFDEFLALACRQEAGLPVIILRFFNTIGPRQQGRYGMVVPRFVAQALAGNPITVHGDGRQKRSFTYVKDVAKAVVDVSLAPSAEGQVFNLGSCQEISINKLAELVRRILNSSSEIVHIPYSEVYGAGFEDPERRLADISKIQKHIEYHPNTDLAVIIREIADDIKAGAGLRGR